MEKQAKTITCRHCGKVFQALTRGRFYCSTRCRRKYQDERRKAERAEFSETRERWKKGFDIVHVFEDPDQPEIYGNPLAATWEDVRPCGFTICQHESVGGPIACQDCPRAL